MLWGRAECGLASKAILCVVQISATGNTQEPRSYGKTVFNRSAIYSLPTKARLDLGNVKVYLLIPIADKNK